MLSSSKSKSWEIIDIFFLKLFKLYFFIDSPSINISPLSISHSLNNKLTKVDLPHPLDPIIAVIHPFLKDIFILFKIFLFP